MDTTLLVTFHHLTLAISDHLQKEGTKLREVDEMLEILETLHVQESESDLERAISLVERLIALAGLLQMFGS